MNLQLELTYEQLISLYKSVSERVDIESEYQDFPSAGISELLMSIRDVVIAETIQLQNAENILNAAGEFDVANMLSQIRNSLDSTITS